MRTTHGKTSRYSFFRNLSHCAKLHWEQQDPARRCSHSCLLPKRGVQSCHGQYYHHRVSHFNSHKSDSKLCGICNQLCRQWCLILLVTSYFLDAEWKLTGMTGQLVAVKRAMLTPRRQQLELDLQYFSNLAETSQHPPCSWTLQLEVSSHSLPSLGWFELWCICIVSVPPHPRSLEVLKISFLHSLSCVGLWEGIWLHGCCANHPTDQKDRIWPSSSLSNKEGDVCRVN